jgi:anti-sigma factor RsiW
MKIQCETFGPRLSAYLDGELADKERQEVQEHLKTCEKCQQLVREMKETAGILKDMRTQSAESQVDLTGVWEEIEARVDFGPTIWQRMRKRVWKPVVWVPAVVAAASVALLVLIRPVPQEQVPMELSRVESVYSQTGSVMVLQTATRGQPLIWILPETGKGGAS